MTGIPPSCRPECVSSSECELSKACKNNRCVNPCSDANCGINSNCRVISHAPICTCKEKYQGDPFVRCYPEERKSFFLLINSFFHHILYSIYVLFSSKSYVQLCPNQMTFLLIHVSHHHVVNFHNVEKDRMVKLYAPAFQI